MASTAFPTTTHTHPHTTTNSNALTNPLRQSSRQTRTNPSRTSKTASRSTFAAMGGLTSSSGLGGGPVGAHGGADPSSYAHNVPHGLYPALSHFTDAITALPKEVRRHASLLKEVDGKAWSLEETLSKQLDAATASTPYAKLMREDVSVHGHGIAPPQTNEPVDYDSPEALARRKTFFDLRATLSDLMITTDEKNHVLWNANNELGKQVKRIETIFPYVEGEISEEARLGSLTHWAYSNKTAKNTGTTGSERPRRETASTRDQNLAAVLEAEARAEHRRETGATRKHRRNHADDDEGRVPARKNTTGKGRGGGETPGNENIHIGTGAVANAAAPTKRRRVDKSQATLTATAMERSVSATTNAGGGRKDGATPDVVKKRIRAPNANPAGRKRTNTVTSTAGSPNLVSSPVVTSYNLPGKASSPAPNTIPRPPSSRAPQTSQAINGRQRPSSSASNRAPNSSTLPGPGPTTHLQVSNQVPEKAISDAKATSAVKDPTSAKAEPSTTGVNGDQKPGLSASRTTDPITKREEAGPSNYSSGSGNSTKTEPTPTSEPYTTAPTPTAAATTTTTTATKGRSSKNSTPVVSTFAETQRTTRPSRNADGPTKRSHKKGAGMAAATQQLIAAAATEDEDSSRQGDDEDDEGEPRYCYCNQVSFGEMVACDNETCPREWFHLSCAGLAKAPLKSSEFSLVN
ncbi:hypothetical protein FQN50_006689 [Emmonsiellopsis sp. PD_5]|nr:hypothetical protein FQN50_006689 [Emmonsiellopsis sp. PD_5]